MRAEQRDRLASWLGVVVFLAGIAVIGLAFFQAWDIFSRAPRLNLGVEPGKPIDFGVVGTNFARLIVQVLLLVLLTGIGSALANRGAKMYASGKTVLVGTPPKEGGKD